MPLNDKGHEAHRLTWLEGKKYQNPSLLTFAPLTCDWSPSALGHESNWALLQKQEISVGLEKTWR